MVPATAPAGQSNNNTSFAILLFLLRLFWIGCTYSSVFIQSRDSVYFPILQSFLLVLFRLLTMQCKWTFTKCFTLSIAQTKCPLLRQQSQKCASLTAIARYIKVISHNRLSTDFQNMALLFKEAWLWSLTKLHIMTLARILPSKACQRDLGTKAANVWDLVQSDRSPFQ